MIIKINGASEIDSIFAVQDRGHGWWIKASMPVTTPADSNPNVMLKREDGISEAVN